MVETLMMMLPELLKIGQGISQNIKSSQYAKTAPPDYEIPQAATQALNSAMSQASQTQLPGQGLAEEKMGAQLSTGISASEKSTDSPASILGQVAKMVSGQNQATAGMTEQAAQNWQDNQGALRQQLMSMAGEQKEQWQWDKQAPYTAAMDAAKSLQNAGQQNVMSGLTGVSNTGMAGAMAGLFKNQNGNSPMGNASGGSGGFDPNSVMQQYMMMRAAKNNNANIYTNYDPSQNFVTTGIYHN